jgi:hypothetical protein
VPSGGLAAIDSDLDGDVTARVIRLLRPAPGLCPAARLVAGLAAAAAVAIPVSLLVLPLR